MAVDRLFEILYLLLDRGRVTAPELAERFEVSVRTIYRDIDALSSAGVPVYAAPGRGGGISLLEGYVLDRAVFSPEEQQQLLTALRSLPPLAGRDTVLSKLSALFGRDEPDWLQVDLSNWGAGETDGLRFDQLRQAILQRHPVELVYVNARGVRQSRRVLPARLVFKGRAWYLQGFCLKRQDWRTFKIGRILEMTVTEERFAEALHPPPAEFGETAELPFAVPLLLRFAPWMAYRVYDEFDSSAIEPQECGAMLVRVTFPEDQWLYGYLLSFGAAVEVLEPAEVRNRLGLLAREIWQNTMDQRTIFSREKTEPDMGCQVFHGSMGTYQTQHKEVPIMEEKFCQSCGMPLTPEVLGSEADGSKSAHYCRYCYQDGGFTGEMTMEEMIEFCVPHMVQAHPDLTPEQAKAQMSQFFPMLMRWRKA